MMKQSADAPAPTTPASDAGTGRAGLELAGTGRAGVGGRRPGRGAVAEGRAHARFAARRRTASSSPRTCPVPASALERELGARPAEQRVAAYGLTSNGRFAAATAREPRGATTPVGMKDADERAEPVRKLAAVRGAGVGGSTRPADAAATPDARRAKGVENVAAADAVIRAGDRLRFRIATADAAGAAVVEESLVDADGTVTLPQVKEAIHSDGLTIAELERHVASTYQRREAAAGARPTTRSRPRRVTIVRVPLSKEMAAGEAASVPSPAPAGDEREVASPPAPAASSSPAPARRAERRTLRHEMPRRPRR